MEHDFEKQRKETYWVWSDLQARMETQPTLINLNLHFVPIHNEKKSLQLKRELQQLGYAVSFYEDDNTLEAKIDLIENTAKEIWLHEKRTTQVALPYG